LRQARRLNVRLPKAVGLPLLKTLGLWTELPRLCYRMNPGNSGGWMIWRSCTSGPMAYR
jgi:hypothetical protein